MQRAGFDQEFSENMVYAKPFISRNGNPYYNPETYLNSQLNMGNKRTPIKPDNFIGFKTLRPDNMQPNRQHNPSGLVWDPVAQGVHIMQTQPIPKMFN
jgi:hypothetical protein